MKIIDRNKVNEYFKNLSSVQCNPLNTEVFDTTFFEISRVDSFPNEIIHIRSKNKIYPKFFEIRLINIMKPIIGNRYQVDIYLNKDIMLYTIKIKEILMNPFGKEIINKLINDFIKDLSVFNKKVEYEKVLPYIIPAKDFIK